VGDLLWVVHLTMRLSRTVREI